MNQLAVAFVGESQKRKNELPNFKTGDTVTVHYRVVEDTKERIQIYKGVVLKKQGTGHTATFCVRKISNGVGVERTFPIHSPFIDKLEINKSAKVRQSKLLYLRGKLEKAMNLKEKMHFKTKKASSESQPKD